MFGLFTNTNKKNTDVVIEATLRASRETREEVAIECFLEMLNASSKAITDLRETYRTAIDDMCDRTGIAEGEKRRSIHQQMFASFDQNLRLTVREYLRDHRALLSPTLTTRFLPRILN